LLHSGIEGGVRFNEGFWIGDIPVLREGKGKLRSVITDNGNAVIDAAFGFRRKIEKKAK